MYSTINKNTIQRLENVKDGPRAAEDATSIVYKRHKELLKMIEGVDLDAIEREQELFNFGRKVETVGNGVVNGAISTAQLGLVAVKVVSDTQTLGMRIGQSILTGEELKEVELLKSGIIKAGEEIAECKEKGLGEYITDEGEWFFRNLNQRWVNTDDTCHEMGEVTGEILWEIALSAGMYKICAPKKPGASTVGNAVDDSLDTLRTSVQQWDDFDKAIEQAQKANGVDELGSLSKTNKYWDEVLEGTKGAGNTVVKDGKISVDGIRGNTNAFSGKSTQEIADMLQDAGYDVTIKKSTRSRSGAEIIQINNPGGGKNITQVQVSPGGGRHGSNPYVKISTSDEGIIKVIDGPESLYKTDGSETATIIFTGGN